MSRSRLLIVRHGETEYNRNGQMQGRGLDAPLNETGHQQAQAVAEYLTSYHVDRVISSSMLRARQSAAHIAERLDKEAIAYEELDEMDFGNWEGRPVDEIAGEMGETFRRWKEGETDHQIPGGESPKDVLERADSRIRQCLKDFPGEDLVIVVHGRLIRILISHWTDIGLPNMEQITHTNCGVNQLFWDGDTFDVVYLNKTDHLVEVL